MNVPGGAGLLAREFDLPRNLAGRPVFVSSICERIIAHSTNSGRVQPCDDHSMLRIVLGPPLEQHGKTLAGRIDAPVKLRREIIEPAIHQPRARVSVDGLKLIETFDLRGKAGPINAERTDADSHPGLRGVNVAIHSLDESIHIVTPPVIA